MRRLAKTFALLALAAAVYAPSASAEFGLLPGPEGFDGAFLEADGSPVTQAGSRPFALHFSAKFNETDDGEGNLVPDGSAKDIVVELAPGMAGDFTKLPRCATEQLNGMLINNSSPEECPIDSQVGVLRVYGAISPTKPGHFPIYNMEPPPGTPADFGVPVISVTVRITPSVRTGEDYGISTSSLNTSTGLPIYGVEADIWGVPSDSSHDTERFPCLDFNSGPSDSKCPVTFPRFPLLTVPGSCQGPLETRARVDSWQNPGIFEEVSFLSHDGAGTPFGLHGCAKLGFDPALTARADTKTADSPTGLHFNLHIPQNENPDGLASAHLKDVKVALPKGLTVNPSSATGLAGCTSAQVDLKGPGAANCPDASKIGTVAVHTPLIDDPLLGEMFVAEPFDNPFDSLIALYISVDDPQTGVVVKLAGEVELGSGGQIASTFEQNPELPFEDLEVRLFGGPRASLRTPALCGTYLTRYELTPWSAPAAPVAKGGDSFQITSGPNGAPCAHSESERPHRPGFEAASLAPLAGRHTPFVVKLSREDGAQELAGLEAILPPGLAAKFAGIPYCPEAALAAAATKSGKAELVSPSCPAPSRIGTVTVAAGAGSQPFHTQGSAYLSGPYKGAPLSISVITPAVAGPFDLGTVLVRTAIYVDPTTAQGRAVSDPFPTVLQGIPLDIRSATVALDRRSFTLNPTSCAEMTVTSRIPSTLGFLATPFTRFQVDDCDRLGFQPRLAMRLKGGTERGDFPKLTATLIPRPGDANIASTVVRLPRSAFLEQGHIRTICTRVQFAADSCPAGSVYGKATAFTPLLDQPLSGPVYLRSSSNNLPDLVFALKGQIEIEAVARIDSIKGGIRATLDQVPDAPVSKFVLQMQGGRKGLIVNSRDLCDKPSRATAKFGAHSGHGVTLRPRMVADCGRGRGGKR
jgi:hypothetical protein